MHKDSRITIQLMRDGWQATFSNIDTMPDGAPLPLPFTQAAQANTIRAHLQSRFPGATIAEAHNHYEPIGFPF